MDERTGIRWKQKPLYTAGSCERTLLGSDIVPITHAPSVEGEEADGKVTMDALAEMVHGNTECLGSAGEVLSGDSAIVRRSGKPLVADVAALMDAEVPRIRPERAEIKCAEIQSLSVSEAIDGDLSGTAEMARRDACGCPIDGTYVRCSDEPVSRVTASDTGAGIDISVSYVGGARAKFSADTRAVVECDSLPEKPGYRVYNVGCRVYSRGVELATKEELDARRADEICSPDGCVYVRAADVVCVRGSSVFDGDLTVTGGIYQRGSSFTTHAEDLAVGSSTITVRDGAQSAMSAEEQAGIVVCRYDGESDMNIFVGQDGVARLGKSSSLQPFLLRAEADCMADGCPLVWDSGNRRAVTGRSLAMPDRICSPDGCTSAIIHGSSLSIDALGGTQILTCRASFLMNCSWVFLGLSDSFMCLTNNEQTVNGICFNSGVGGVGMWPYINVHESCKIEQTCGLISQAGATVFGNGIGFRCSTGNDSAWIRFTEDPVDNGVLEIAVGDNATDCIVFRKYNVDGAAEVSTCVPSASGSFAVVESFDASSGTLCLRG